MHVLTLKSQASRTPQPSRAYVRLELSAAQRRRTFPNPSAESEEDVADDLDAVDAYVGYGTSRSMIHKVRYEHVVTSVIPELKVACLGARRRA